jgi:hypothetical protein
VGTVGSAIEMPTPATSSAAVSSIQLVFSAPRAATQMKPMACTLSPTTMIGRRPARSDSAPGKRRYEHRRREERQQPQPGPERRVAAGELELLPDEERRREDGARQTPPTIGPSATARPASPP